MPLSGPAPLRRTGAMGPMGRAARVVVQHQLGGGTDLAAFCPEPWSGGGRAPALRRDSHLRRYRGDDGTVPPHDRTTPRGAALCRALVSHWSLRMDDDESR